MAAAFGDTAEPQPSSIAMAPALRCATGLGIAMILRQNLNRVASVGLLKPAAGIASAEPIWGDDDRRAQED
jgi:hypothetical protein